MKAETIEETVDIRSSGYTMKTANNADNSLGLDKQCVAFARRWLHKNKGMVFGDVQIAADIWANVNFYRLVASGKRIPVTSVPNGGSCLPQVGDLIIYGEKYRMTGHVSVVVNIDTSSDMVLIYEQNFENIYQYPHQERFIHFINKRGRYWLLDDFILGWKSLQYSSG